MYIICKHTDHITFSTNTTTYDMCKSYLFFFRDERVPLLTHCGRVTHICISKLTITSSDNGLLPGGGQAIIWTNAGILLISTLGTDFSEISIEIDLFSFQRNAFDKVICKMSFIVSQLQCVKNLFSSGWNLTKRRDESDYDNTAHYDLCPVDSCVNLLSALDSRNGVMSMRTSPHLRALLINNNPCGQQFS